MGRDVEGNIANIGHDPCGSLWGWREGLGEQTERFQFWMEGYPGMSPASWIRRVPTVKGAGEDARLPQGGRQAMHAGGGVSPQRAGCLPQAWGLDGPPFQRGRAAASGDTLCVLEPR